MRTIRLHSVIALAFLAGSRRNIGRSEKMRRFLTGLMIAVLAAAVLYADTTFADQRPGKIVVMGGTLSLTGRFAVPAGRTHNAFKMYVDELNARGAQAIFSNSYFADSVAQVRQLRKLSINVKILAGTVGPAVPKFVEELGSTAEYVLGFSTWEPKPVLGHPGMKAFIENYEKRYGEKPNYHASIGYDQMQILEAAVKHVGSFDPERVRDALASIRVETIAGPWKADEQGLGNREGLTFQIQNGERVIVWPAHMAEARFLPMPKWEDRPKE